MSPEQQQDLVSAFQHLALAINGRAGTQEGNLEWARYHLTRATQGWPDAWGATLLHEDLEAAARRLTGGSDE